jgi:hypothetical protein
MNNLFRNPKFLLTVYCVSIVGVVIVPYFIEEDKPRFYRRKMEYYGRCTGY